MPDRPVSLDIIIDKIRQQSSREIEAIQQAAEREKELIMRRAAREAERIRGELIEQARARAEIIRKQVAAVAGLEVKRLSLQAKTIIIAEIIKQVKEQLLNIRQTPEYRHPLQLMVLEGVRGLNVEKVYVSGGDREQVVLTPGLLNSVETEISRNLGLKIHLMLSQEIIPDAGVILFAADKRLRFDNRLALRVERMFEAHRWLVMQEFIDNNQQD